MEKVSSKRKKPKLVITDSMRYLEHTLNSEERKTTRNSMVANTFTDNCTLAMNNILPQLVTTPDPTEPNSMLNSPLLTPRHSFVVNTKMLHEVVNRSISSQIVLSKIKYEQNERSANNTMPGDVTSQENIK